MAFSPPPPPAPGRKGSTTSKVIEALGHDALYKKKHKEHDEPHAAHGDNDELWLVSYSDLMTLLFGFFVILFSMSTLDKNKFTGFAKGASEKFGGEYQLPTEQVNRAMAASLNQGGLKSSDVQITQTVDGLELNFKGQAFFNSGTAELSEAARVFVIKAADAIKKTGNDYMVRIEGHTDDAPISTVQFPSNWELSSARATAVVRILEADGLNPRQLEAIGYGSSRPLKPNRDEKGQAIADNMAANRRILIHLRKLEPSELRRKLSPSSDAKGEAKNTEVSVPASAMTAGVDSSATHAETAVPTSPSAPAPASASASTSH